MEEIKTNNSILILVISNAHMQHYNSNKDVWLSYMNKYDNIDCFFIEYTNEIESITVENNTVFIKGEEKFENIIHKTLDSMDYFMNSDKHYDFIIRTNLSSIWDFDKLQDYLNTLPKTNIYAGLRGPFYNKTTYNFWFYFIGGMGIIMSNDICKLLIKNRNITESFKDMDDTDIGYTMHQFNIPLLEINYCYIYSMSSFENNLNSIMNKEHFFYRAKSESNDRLDEPIYMKKIVDIIYNSTK